MSFIWQAAANVSSWFYTPATGVGKDEVKGAAKVEATGLAFAALASRDALKRPLAENYNIALNARSLRADKVRVRSNLAAAADKVGVDAVRKAIVARLGDKGVHQAVALQQLNRVVREAPAITHG